MSSIFDPPVVKGKAPIEKDPVIEVIAGHSFVNGVCIAKIPHTDNRLRSALDGHPDLWRAERGRETHCALGRCWSLDYWASLISTWLMMPITSGIIVSQLPLLLWGQRGRGARGPARDPELDRPAIH